MGLFSFLSRSGKNKAPKVDALPYTTNFTLYRDYPEDTITPTRLKHILKDADIGYTAQYMELLDAASVDYKIGSLLRTRKLCVAGAPMFMKPGDDSELAKQIAEEAEDFFRAIPDYVQFMCDLLDAHYRGFACIRPEWEVIDGRQMITSWEAIESRFFYFENATTPKIVTQSDPLGVPVPDGYLLHTMRDKAGPAVRGGTGRSIVRLWLYKGYNLVDMASYLEKFGSPHIQVTIPKHYVEGSAELERAKSAARALVVDHIGLVPEDVKIEMLETISRKTATLAETYIGFAQWCDEGVAMAELGHTLTSGASMAGGMGHGGEAAEAGDVRQDLKDHDAMSLCAMLCKQLIWPRTERQYGPNAPKPTMCLEVMAEEDEEQKGRALKLRAEAVAILANTFGEALPLSLQQMRHDFDLHEPAGPEDSIGSMPKPGMPGEDPKPPKKAPPAHH